MPNETKAEWPAWYSSPTGAETVIFNKPEDVPAGWTTGSEQKTVNGDTVKSVAKATPAPKPAAAQADAKKAGRPRKTAKPAAAPAAPLDL